MNTINSLVDWLTQSNSVLMNKNKELEQEITRNNKINNFYI